jgi:hypothetical protein
VKDYVKGALTSLMDTEEGEARTFKEEVDFMEQQEMGSASGASLSNVGPKHVTGPHGEAHQEQ